MIMCVVSSGHCGACTITANFSHKLDLCRATWVFQSLTVGEQRFDQVLNSQSLFAGFPIAITHTLVFLSKHVMHLTPAVLKLLTEPPFSVTACFCAAPLPTPSSCEARRGSSVSQLYCSVSVLWDVELEPKALYVPVWWWEDLDLNLCQIPYCPFPSPSCSSIEWSVITNSTLKHKPHHYFGPSSAGMALC